MVYVSTLDFVCLTETFRKAIHSALPATQRPASHVLGYQSTENDREDLILIENELVSCVKHIKII